MVQESLQTRQDRTHLFLRLSWLVFIVQFIPGISILVLGPVRGWMGSDIFSLAGITYLVVSMLGLACVISGHLQKKSIEEEEDRLLLERRKERTQVFTDTDDYLFNASNTLARFRRYGSYVLLGMMVLAIASSLAGFWYTWADRPELLTSETPAKGAFIALLLALFGVFGGVFCIGQSREREFRWLRPVGAWLVLGALILGLASLELTMRHLGAPSWDGVGRYVIFWILALLSLELLSNSVIEFYRPRTMAEGRPVFESRLLALFTEPGGVVKNIAETLDYQFGFQASKTWVYRSLEGAVIPLILVWLIILWLFTMVAEISPGEQGIRERFGKIVNREPLFPGVYLKLPWPCERIARYGVDELQEVIIGSQLHNPDEKTPAGKRELPATILWTEKHYASESRYLVATHSEERAGEEVPVSFLSAMIPIQYRIKNIFNYAYRHQDSRATLSDIAEREVAKYLASADLLQVMSTARGQATMDLKKNIQDAANRLELGIKIVTVNLHDAHPPVEEVSPSFQEVVGAQEEMEAEILKAESYRKKTLPDARAQAREQISTAEAYRDGVIKVAEADAERFHRQIQAYRIMPSMFVLRTYLDFLEADTGEIRKFVVSDSNRDDWYVINLEEKARLDLLDADLTDFRE